MKPKKPNHLKLVVNNEHALTPKETDVDIAAAADSGERILSSGHDDDFPATDSLPTAEREKRGMVAAARALPTLVAKVSESYDARGLRDPKAGKLGYALLFVGQAGLSQEEIDDFLDNYTSPADDNDPGSIQQGLEESARLTDSLITLQELFEYLVNADGKIAPTNLTAFRQDWENSNVWNAEDRQQHLLDAVGKAFTVCKYKADRMALTPEGWLQFCIEDITTDGMRMPIPQGTQEIDVLDEFDDKRDKKFEEAWNKWMRKPTGDELRWQ